MESLNTPADAFQNIPLDNFRARKTDSAALNEIQRKLRLSYRELLRMENEGGTPLSDEEAANIHEHFLIRKSGEKSFFEARARRGLPQI